jgi:hypothetical protein
VAERVRELTRSMRTLLVLAGVLVFLAGVQLFLFPLRTERYFSWTIDVPMTAVFLGASYWSSLVFEWSAARRTRWVDARIAVPTVFVFTTLTLVATLVHRDKFHFGSEFEASTRTVTWAWTAIYVVVPIAMLVLMVVQTRQPGVDPPRTRPLARWVRIVLALEAVLLLGVGLALFVDPVGQADIWPWSLTPLTARAIGAWCIGLGVAAAQAWWEDDVLRLRPAAHAFAAFAILQAIALARHGDALDWDRPSSWVYVAFLASAAIVGASVMVAAGAPEPGRDRAVDLRGGVDAADAADAAAIDPSTLRE